MSSEKIGFIGKGNVGSAIKRGLDGSGHETKMVGHDPESEKETAAWADIIFLAVPFAAINQTLDEIGKDIFKGKTVVDVTNNFNPQAQVPSMGGSEELQKKIPNARVVKTFNHVFSSNMDSVM
jgi:8-hydroxy-5-deazaflavin:NADPH oxidoreductase